MSKATKPNLDQQRVTRLAPSPTGALHLGNARTFLVNWAMARQLGWRVLLRIEDLDGPRVKDGADRRAIEDLQWLGMDWDDGPVFQLMDTSAYEEALAKLSAAGLTYECKCTRSEIAAAQSAPHGDEHELRYPGTCRPGAAQPQSDEKGADHSPADGDRPTATRITVPDVDVTFIDRVVGEQTHNVQQQVGDFVIATKAGLPAYQLAVVVDDARQGVTDVVRGDDLLRSTARQILIYRMLGLGEGPTWWHLPLVQGEDGRRLAKRHGDTRIAFYREQGVAAERVIGLLAYWSGIHDTRRPMSARDFVDGLDLERMPKGPTTFTQEDHAWLVEA